MTKKWLCIIWGLVVLASCAGGGHASVTSVSSGSNSYVSASTGDASSVSNAGSSSVGMSFTVRFYTDSTLLETDSVKKGEAASYHGATPTKDKTDQFTYTFTGWDKSLANIVADTDFYAQYSSDVNTYTIRFLDGNAGQTVLQSSSVAYGQMPRYIGETPTKTRTPQYEYSFSGWTPQIVAVTGAADYVATYASTLRAYTIRFLNSDDTVLQTSEWNYGTMPTYNGETPTQASTAKFDYTFDRWDKEIVSVSGKADYKATYTSKIRKYTVSFVDYDGSPLQTSEWEYGTTPSYTGTIPTRATDDKYSYTFNNSWSPALGPVTENITYTAVYATTPVLYKISFVNWDGTSLYSGKFYYNSTPSYPLTYASPTRAGDVQYTSYTFAGWDPVIVPVVADATYTAKFTGNGLKSYTVTFLDDDGTTTLSTQTCDYGSYPTFPTTNPTKASPTPLAYSYAFAGWNPSTPQQVTGNQTYQATYTKTTYTYTLTFKDWDGTVLATRTLTGGDSISTSISGITTQRSEDRLYQSYTFTGWSPAITSASVATADTTYTAQYTGNNAKTYSAVFDSSHNHLSSYVIPSTGLSSEYAATSITYQAGSVTAGTDTLSKKVSTYFYNQSDGLGYKDTTDSFIELTKTSSTKNTITTTVYFFFDSNVNTASGSLSYTLTGNNMSYVLATFDRYLSNDVTGIASGKIASVDSGGSGHNVTSSTYGETLTANSGTAKALSFTWKVTFTGTITFKISSTALKFTYGS